MAENARQFFWYAGLILVAGIIYFLVQTAILRQTIDLPIRSYLACLEKAGRIDWSKYGVKDGPSASEICSNRSTRPL